MFKLYIFDMGGVVTNSVGCEEAEILSSSYFDQAVLYSTADKDLDALVVGAIESTEFLRRFAATTGREIEDDLLTRCFRPEPDRAVMGLIASLRKRARVVVGTNTIAPHYDIHLVNGDYNDFDAVYASHLIGLAKPDSAFYLRIVEQENHRPEETVFIDDREINVEAAREIGMHAIVFKNTDQLMREFAASE